MRFACRPPRQGSMAFPGPRDESGRPPLQPSPTIEPDSPRGG
jgi:hypothetical protein